VRFDVVQRVQHALLLLSFTILAVTGLVQKFATAALSEKLIGLLGGIESTRVIHRSAAVVLCAVAIYHVLDAAYRVFVLRTPLSMLPLVEDFASVSDVCLSAPGSQILTAASLRQKVGTGGVWGTLVMALAGFMM
jgi:hypothetical protein